MLAICVYSQIAMNMPDYEKYAARAKVAKALAHPSRLMIVDLLQHQELSVTQLTDAVGADQSTVSKHLSVLKSAGLVSARKDGPVQWYRVTCGCLDGFFSCLENVLRCDVNQRQAVLRKRRR